ncbi:MAG: prepilin-type N-terminal cleavage/methylation domain-containing protein [Armatimonadota bacterium]|nr:prepilin-type N-terminal cleavage/methylation domain-containing protein [Armatimonadota bacterium]
MTAAMDCTVGCLRERGGFTLTELLVVIGIAVLLMGIMIPTGKALRDSNQQMECKAQLQQIGQALRMYEADEGGAPPYYIDASQTPDDPPSGPGLLALYETGHLGRRRTLHCPRDVYADPESDEYFQSYMRRDLEKPVAADTTLNEYSYLNSRGVTDDTDPHYRRQLQPCADVGGTSPVPVVMPGWRPADDTVVTWCGFHTATMTEGGVGQYYVLFWDGSVGRVSEEIMTDPAVGPDAAWKVDHEDASG